jgi:RecA-family ATPase
MSGSTAWHNSVRARAYMRPIKTDDGTEPDKSLRVVEFVKSNYGPVADSITVRWKNGAFLPEPKTGSLERLASEAKADDLFLKLLDRFNRQDRNVSDKSGRSYAPAVFANEPEAREAGASKNSLTQAMNRLFKSDRIHLVQYDSPCRNRFRLTSGAKP